MKVSLRALLLAVAMTTPAWLSASADEGVAIRFIGGEAYDTAASQVSYNNMEVALGGGCAAPAGCAAAAPSCGAAAPSCGADAACGADNGCGCNDGCDDCCDFDFGPFLPCKRWAVFAGAPIMVRQNFHDGLVYGGAVAAAPSDNVLVAPSAGVYSGFQGNIIKYRDSGRDIDFGFMFIGSSPTAMDVLFQPSVIPPIGDLNNFAAVLSNYQSSLISVEGNLRLRTSDWFSWIAGVRYINLSENLSFLAFGDGPSLATGLIRTNNNLLGGQFGASAILAAHGRWTFNGQVRGGVYYNDCTTNVAGLINVTPVSASNDSNPWAVEADGQLTASYWLTDHFALRFGYQVMWLDRVALAPSQLANVTGPTSVNVNDSSTPFWHGALVQGEVVW